MVAAATTAVLLIAGCSSSSKNASADGGGGGAPGSFKAIPNGTIKLCGSYPISGENAAFGSSGQKTAAIAQDLINNQFGGIAGHKVEVKISDDKSDSQTAVDIANQYASEHKSNSLDCPIVYQISQNPRTAPLQAAVLNKAKIVMLATQSPNAFHDPSKFPYFFSLNPSYSTLGDVAAHYLIKNKLVKAAVLTNSLDDSKEYLQGIQDAATKQGGKIDFVKTVQLPVGAVSAQTQLSQLRTSNPDVLIVATQFGFGPIWKSLKAISWSPKIMGDVGTIYDSFNDLGSLAAGTVAPCWWALNKGQAIPDEVVQTVNKIAPINGGFAPDPLIASQVSVSQILLAKYAIEKYNSVDPAAIEKALNELNGGSIPKWWPDLKFSFAGSPRSGPVGDYGPGICAGTAPDKIGNGFNSVAYVDDYRGPESSH